MVEPGVGTRGRILGGTWPTVPSPSAAQLLALLHQLEYTQWWPQQRLIEHQLPQLEQLLAHAYSTVPFYQRWLDGAGYRPGRDLALDDWRALPLLTRRDVQDAGCDLISRAIPSRFGQLVEAQTSGSTGEPVKLLRTEVDLLMWEAITLREHHWHRRDLSGKLASIRVFLRFGAPPHGTSSPNWGLPTNRLYATGPLEALSLTADVRTQAEWLLQHEPDYLLTYPNNLWALIEHLSKRGKRLRRLREVRTIGETVTAELRAACRDQWGVPLTDVYSSQELGYLAIQCPATEHYHVMAESALVEVLGVNGKPCRPGEIGRMVVSKLHNFATPLIRYELRDYAELGPPCPCGRGLPTLKRILGRSRNMLTLPTGEQRWPISGFYRFREIAPIRQYQLVQHTLEDIEVRFVAERKLRADEEARLTEVIRQALGYPFKLSFMYFADEIPRAPGGKFEEFVSRLAT